MLIRITSYNVCYTKLLRAGRSIPALFEDEGEDGFRRRERAALEGVAAGGPAVLATGGGTVELPENRAILLV